MPFSTQSVSWVPCLKKYDDIKACRIITSPSLLYAKAQKFEETVTNILRKSKWANETEALTIAFLNYVGWNNGYHKDNTTASAARDLAGRDPPSPRLTYSESWLAWSYQQCTEIGLFQTGDNPRADALPVLSRLITLHYLKNMYCRDQLYINLTETSISAKLNNYGGLNISYPRLMLTGGEVDPVRISPDINHSLHLLTNIFESDLSGDLRRHLQCATRLRDWIIPAHLNSRGI